jgi:preprotein translocase subunit SecY
MPSASGLLKITKVPEIRRRLIFTLMVIAIYRVGIFITVPGVDRGVMKQVVSGQGGLLGLFNLFSGKALEQLSIFSLGIMPYISASIIVQLLGMVSKQVEEMRKEGEAGRRKLERYTRFGTVGLAIFQSFGMAWFLEGLNGSGGGTHMGDVVASPGFAFKLMTVLTLTAGTVLLMWLGEQATDRGIGSGISLIIFASIVSAIPSSVASYWAGNSGEVQPLTVAVIVAVLLASIAVVVFFEKAQRQIPIQYARRQMGRRVYGGEQAHLPFKVNMASMVPAIFASSLLMFPATLANYNVIGAARLSAVLNSGGWVFMTLFAALIVFFCFFYTAVTFQPVDVADNLQKQQANIPGIRPGRQTAEYLDGVITRLTVGGSIYVAGICTIPSMIAHSLRVPFQFGGSSLMIVVGVALETVNQIEAQLVTQSYEEPDQSAGVQLSGRRLAEQK